MLLANPNPNPNPFPRARTSRRSEDHHVRRRHSRDQQTTAAPAAARRPGTQPPPRSLLPVCGMQVAAVARPPTIDDLRAACRCTVAVLPILPYIYISVLFRTCSLLSDLSDSVSFCGLLPFVCNFTHRHIDAYSHHRYSSCCRDRGPTAAPRVRCDAPGRWLCRVCRMSASRSPELGPRHLGRRVSSI